MILEVKLVLQMRQSRVPIFLFWQLKKKEVSLGKIIKVECHLQFDLDAVRMVAKWTVENCDELWWWLLDKNLSSLSFSHEFKVE